ncbi:MAG TPA: hypothetical protein VGK32_19850 [Vicinamibacterales bacterium]|jgi:hypothetical protein
MATPIVVTISRAFGSGGARCHTFLTTGILVTRRPGARLAEGASRVESG